MSSEADFENQQIDEGTVYCMDHAPNQIKKSDMKTVSTIFFGVDRMKKAQTFRAIEN
jgi:hypothetical protein